MTGAPAVPAATELTASEARARARDASVAVRAAAPAWLRSERFALLLVALWIPVQLLLAWPAPLAPAFDGPWRYDPAIFAYEGALVRAGGMPYVTFWDHKGPLIYLINAAGLSISGGHIWGVWAAGLVAILAAAGMGYRAMRDAAGPTGALVGVLFFLFALSGIETASNMTEQYALPLSWGAALVLVHWSRAQCSTFRSALVLGALGALLVLLRANLVGAVATAALVMTAVLLRNRQGAALLRLVAGMALGACAVSVPVVVWLARGHALHAFWDQAILYNLLYAHTDWTQRAVAATAGVWLATVTAPLLLPVAGIVLCLWRLQRRPADKPMNDDRAYRNASHVVPLFAVTWPCVELAFASVSGRPFDHYFMMLLPPFALLAAAAIGEGIALAPPRVRGHALTRSPLLLATLFALVTIRPVIDRFVLRARAGSLPPAAESSQTMLTASFVQANSAPTGRLLVWGLAGGVYFLADRPPASRYLFAFPLLTPGYGERVAPTFLAELRRTPPELIVDATVSDESVPALSRWDATWSYPRTRWQASYRAMTPALRPFYDFVAQHYTAIAVVGPERWVVYRANAAPVVP